MKSKHLESNKSGKRKGSALLTIVLIVLTGGVLFSGWKLFSIWAEYRKSASEYSSLSDEFVRQNTDGDDPDASSPAISEPFDPSQSSNALPEETLELFQRVDMKCGFTVDFEGMLRKSSDVVAWISSPGTAIDYPVMHGETNDTYLHANLKGEYRVSGSIFVHARNTGNLWDYNTIVYGHNMKDGSMFHSIKSYSSQSYYEEHPYIWYVTPQANFVLYVVAGYVAGITNEIYDIAYSPEDVRELLQGALYWSDFTPDYVLCGLDAETIVENATRIVVLSTCSYEFDNARYVLVTVPLLAE